MVGFMDPILHSPGSFAKHPQPVTALRSVLVHAGVRAPHTGQPYSEAMLLGIAGGIGAGVVSFLCEKGDFPFFFIAGRHDWQDDPSYLRDGLTSKPTPGTSFP
jgi:hypothetical protein